MVRLDHALRVATCTLCRSTQELSKQRSPESFIIAADTFKRTHSCRRKRIAKPVTKTLDRWHSLFASIKF